MSIGIILILKNFFAVGDRGQFVPGAEMIVIRYVMVKSEFDYTIKICYHIKKEVTA